MEDKIINNKNSLCNNSSHSRSPVKSYSPDFSKATFEEVLEWVKDNSSFECFEETQRTAAEEICLIMAEVLKLPSGLNVRIGGNDLPAELVGSVYKRIQKEHIERGFLSRLGRRTANADPRPENKKINRGTSEI